MDRITEEAANWLVREADEAMDWAGFTIWLEVDPRHRAAYNELALIDARIGEHAAIPGATAAAPQPVPANDAQPPRWGRWAGVGGATIAAGLALVFALQPVARNSPIQDFRSPAGKSSQIALGDGTRIVLAPASHLTVQGEQLALAGTGYFDVPHKPGRTLVVRAGDFQITDVGTRFAVANEADGVSVDVAEGALSVTSAQLAAPIALAAGHGLYADRSSGTVSKTKVDPGRVATWRSGKLQFDEAPLALVARDISRYSGATVTVDPAIAGQPFSGVIAIDEGASPARAVAQILSLDAKPVAGGIRLEPRRR